MLLQFSVENYRSFKNRITLSLEASSDDSLPNNIKTYDKDRILKVATVFGPNASGKSNVFNALTTSILAIRNSEKMQIEQKNMAFEPFLLDESSRNKPCSFEYVFLTEGQKYVYGFSATQSAIVEEYLYLFKTAKASVIFERTEDQYKFTSPKLENEMRPLTERNTSNKLFLSTATLWNCEATRAPFSWFNNTINTYDTDVQKLAPITDPMYAADKDTSLKQFTNRLLQEADININDFIFEAKTGNPEQFFDDMPNELKEIFSKFPVNSHTEYKAMTIHKVDDKEFQLPIYNESVGTRELFSIAPILKRAFETGEAVCIDEFDKSLHPMLVLYLVDLFNNPNINKENAQLIISSHTMSLLSLEHLRRDQIYFAEKNRTSAESELFSLDEFSPRRQENIRRSYLLGRYGSIPLIPEEADLWQ